MNSVRLVGDGGAEKVEGKGREMSQRARLDQEEVQLSGLRSAG